MADCSRRVRFYLGTTQQFRLFNAINCTGRRGFGDGRKRTAGLNIKYLSEREREQEKERCNPWCETSIKNDEPMIRRGGIGGNHRRKSHEFVSGRRESRRNSRLNRNRCDGFYAPLWFTCILGDIVPRARREFISVYDGYIYVRACVRACVQQAREPRALAHYAQRRNYIAPCGTCWSIRWIYVIKFYYAV